MRRLKCGFLLAFTLTLTFISTCLSQTELGSEDDLTVLGTDGTWADSDVEIKGFSIFGSTTGLTPQIEAAPGNLVIRGKVQISSYTYFGSSVTVASYGYFGDTVTAAGYGVFLSTVQITEGNLKYGAGAAGKVLKSGGAGFVYWGDDQGGASSSGIQYRIPMWKSGTELTTSTMHQDGGGNSITLLSSTLTVQGNAFSVGGSTFVVKEGNVGIGTTGPTAILHVTGGGILASGTSGSTPVSGAGTRFMWIPAKAALVAGSASSAQFDDSTIAANVINLGRNNTAAGPQSVTLGDANETSVAGSAQTAIGGYNTVNGSNSVGIGFFNLLSGNQSHAFGQYLTVSGNYAMALGQGVNGTDRLINSVNQSLAIGFNSTIPTLFVSGGSGVGTLGNVGIGTTSPNKPLTVAGDANLSGTLASLYFGSELFLRGGSSEANSIFTEPGGQGILYIKGGRLADILVTIGDNPANEVGKGTMGIGGGATSGVVVNVGRSPNPSITNSELISLQSDSYTHTISAALTTERVNLFKQVTVSAATAQTVTNAATLAIDGPPTASGAGPASITTAAALKIAGGAVANVTNAYSLYVDTPTGAINNYAAVFAGGNVGIATTTPQGLLHVGAGATPGLLVTSAGNVGIGTTSPAKKLDIAGAVDITTIGSGDSLIIKAEGSNPDVQIYRYQNTTFGPEIDLRLARGTIASPLAVQSNDNLGFLTFGGYTGSGFGFGGLMSSFASQNWTGTGNGADLRFYTTLNGSVSYAERMRIDQAGNVGIGTTGPNRLFHVYSPGDTYQRISAGTVYTDLHQDGAGFRMHTSGLANALTIIDSGSVGIGVIWAQNKLDVEGAAVIGATYSGSIVAPTNGLLVEGNVGIGTTSPGRKFVVTGSDEGMAEFESTNAGADGGIIIKHGKTGGKPLLSFQNSGGELGWIFWDPTLDAFQVNAGNLAVEGTGASYILGNVGIGTTGPGYRLVVSSGAGEAGTILAVSTGASVMVEIQGDGDVIAKRFIGDGSQLTNTAGDNLGDHIATTVLQMGNYGINSSSDITAARYQIAGSTVLAILPGTGSLGVGVDAGRVNTGNYNSFFGSNAGRTNTDGGYNSFLGGAAGYSNNTGAFNTFVGYEAGRTNTGGAANSFLGAWAGYSNTTGGRNSFVGYQAGYSNSTGFGNSFFGVSAGISATGSSSTLIGYEAGNGLTTGSGNVFLGWRAGYNIATGTGNIIVGYNQLAPAGNTNNFLNIGGLIYGDLSAKTIGISTRVPQAALDIVSTGTATNIYAQIWRDGSGVIVSSMTSTGVLYPQPTPAGDNLGSHVAAATLNMADKPIISVSSMNLTAAGLTGSQAIFQVAGSTMVVLNNGNLGIGTTNPSRILQVNSTSLPAVSLALSGTERGVLGVAGSAGDWFVGSVAGDVALRSENGDFWIGTYPSFPIRFAINNSQRMIIDNSGNVGIGTTGPNYRLQVSSGAGEAGTILAVSTGASVMVEIQGDGDVIAKRFIGDGSQLTNTAGDNMGSHTATTHLNMASKAIFNASSMTITGVGITGANPIFTVASSTFNILANGNIGVGVAAPSNKLEVASLSGTNLQFDTSNSAYVSLKVNGVEVARMRP